MGLLDLLVLTENIRVLVLSLQVSGFDILVRNRFPCHGFSILTGSLLLAFIHLLLDHISITLSDLRRTLPIIISCLGLHLLIRRVSGYIIQSSINFSLYFFKINLLWIRQQILGSGFLYWQFGWSLTWLHSFVEVVDIDGLVEKQLLIILLLVVWSGGLVLWGTGP